MQGPLVLSPVASPPRCLDFVALGLALQHRAVKGTRAGPAREAPSRACHHVEGGVPSATLLCGPARFPPCWGEAGPFASDWNYLFGLFALDYKARFVLVCTVTL